MGALGTFVGGPSTFMDPTGPPRGGAERTCLVAAVYRISARVGETLALATIFWDVAYFLCGVAKLV
jgi:hypothetical protein